MPIPNRTDSRSRRPRPCGPSMHLPETSPRCPGRIGGRHACDLSCASCRPTPTFAESLVWNLLARSRAVSSPITTAHSPSPPAYLPSMPRAASAAASAKVTRAGVSPRSGQAAVGRGRQKTRRIARRSFRRRPENLKIKQVGNRAGQVRPQRLFQPGQNRLILAPKQIGPLQPNFGPMTCAVMPASAVSPSAASFARIFAVSVVVTTG